MPPTTDYHWLDAKLPEIRDPDDIRQVQRRLRVLESLVIGFEARLDVLTAREPDTSKAYWLFCEIFGKGYPGDGND